MEAVGTMLAKVNVRGITVNAKLVVRSFGGPFENLRVRLPKGAQLIPQETATYSVLPLASGGPAGKDGKAVEVRFSKPISGPVELQFASTLPHQPGSCDLAGYEVIDAVRQSGQIAVAADSQWRVLLGPNRGVRQIDASESLRVDGLVAAFEYFVQPYKLEVRVVPRDTYVSVDPEYVFLVGAGRVTMQARLRYAVRTAKVRALEMELLDWQLDDAGPENQVATDAAAIDAEGLLTIPLKQESMGQIEINVRADRRIAPGTTSLVLEVPHPRAHSQAQAAVVILPDDDVELVPAAETPAGLVRQQVAPPMKLPDRQQDPLYFRAEPGKAVFAAGFRVHERSQRVVVASEVQVDDGRARVDQKFAYTIAYVPVNRLWLEVPRSVAASGQLKILMDGKPLATAEPVERPGSANPVRRQVILPALRIGRCEVAVSYSVELDKLLPAASIPATIPLVMPAEGELAGNRVVVNPKEGIRVQARGGPWTTDAGVAQPETRPGTQCAGAGPRTRPCDPP